jgi:hypothetical protein
VRKVLTLTGRSIRGVPVLGVGLTFWQVNNDIAAGKPSDRAVTSGVAGLTAGATATFGASYGAALALGVSGGPVTLGAVAIGIGASALTGWAVEHYWDDIENTAVGRAIGNSPIGHAFNAIS